MESSPLLFEALPGTTIGLAGERSAALAAARGLILQTAVLHGPAEVRIVVVTHHSHVADWEWLKWLPHVRPAFAGGRLLAVVSDAAGVIDGAAIDEALSDIDINAVVVAVVDTTALLDSGDVAIRRLLRRPETPATGIVIAPTGDGLPDQCDVVVDHHRVVFDLFPVLFVLGRLINGT